MRRPIPAAPPVTTATSALPVGRPLIRSEPSGQSGFLRLFIYRPEATLLEDLDQALALCSHVLGHQVPRQFRITLAKGLEQSWMLLAGVLRVAGGVGAVGKARCNGIEDEHEARRVCCSVDLAMANDVTAPGAIDALRAMGAARVWDRTKVALVASHFVPAKDIASAGMMSAMRAFAREQAANTACAQYKSAMSSGAMGATTNPRRGRRLTSPSLRRESRPSRTGVWLIPSTSAIGSMRRNSPGRARPEVIRSRT